MISPGQAADVILNGVRKNKSLIVFPFYARLFTMIYRISPRLMELLNIVALKRMKKVIG